MKKKGLPLLTGIVVLILLLVLYMVLIRQNAKIAEEESDTPVKVMKLESEDVAMVQFMLDGNEETFTLENDTWSLASDTSFKVDSSKISTLLDSVTGMAATRILEDVTDLTEYGFDQPVQTIILTAADGSVYTICWGSSNDVTGDDYVYVKENKNRVYTIDCSILDSLGDTIEDYRAEEEEITEKATEEDETGEETTDKDTEAAEK